MLKIPAFLNSAFVCLLFGVSSAAVAQDSDGVTTDENDLLLEEVVVTGSRIKRSNLDSPAPVMVFDSEMLLNTGITTLEEFARYLPQNADTFSDSMTTGSIYRGSAAFNLRGIGLDGTLTLVNGRRIAPFGGSGDTEPFVDINAIPVAAIERIEVLKDGASAIYGSEAVAGVINIITRKHVEGVTVEGGFLTTSEGDGDEWDIAITGGWANGTTSVTGTLSYLDRDPIYSRDREWASDIDLSDKGGWNGRSWLSSPPTAFLLESGLWAADPECPEHDERNTHLVLVPGFVEGCLFNWAWYMTLQQPSERLGMNAFLEHAFSQELTLFAELLLNRNETQSIMAPTPFFSQWIPGFHPDNPWGEDLLMYGRILDSGDRGFDNESTTWRALTGLRGNWSTWEWEAALMASESEVEETIFNGISAVAFEAAVIGMGGPNGDQFYNPFGHNTQNSPEIIEYMLVNDASSVATTEELTADLQVSGNFWDLQGGPAGAAFGIQARTQELDQAVDEILASGTLGGGAPQPLQADRDIWSVFGEVMLPLLPSLEAQLALRYDHYSDFGSTTNPKIGLGWRPLDELLVRATWGTSFRPPTFRDLYEPPIDGFAVIEEDPHRCPVTGDPLDCYGYPVVMTIRGNPDLEPDEGETLLLGAAWEPSFAPGLELSIDFWQLEHENRILFSGTQDIENLLLHELDPFNNPFFERAPQTPEDLALGIPGYVLAVHHTAINGDTVDTNGIDFAIRYSWDTSRAGMFDISLDYTYLNEFESGIDMLGVQNKEDYAGGYGEIGGLPEHRANLRASWNLGSHGASALVAYAGEYDSWLNIHVDEVDTGEVFTVDDYTQLDLQYNYVFSSLRDGMLRIGCRNCTDEDPPVYNYDVASEAFHEGRGAMWYVRWSQPF